jgi:ATP-dependent helicase HrpB
VIPLPIDPLVPQILDSIGRHRNLVLEAPPGAGKTTRVPPALLAIAKTGVLVLEPRRIAARMAARRVAEEMGERQGETVGYQVRFEEVSSAKTKLRFLTEGVLTRRLMSDPQLHGVDVVVLDEFHERHLDGDLALALLRRLQQSTRPELKIVVMSATLDAAPIAEALEQCPILRSEGRLFDLKISYTPPSGATLEDQVAAALPAALKQNGDVLVFLPGAAEIRRAIRTCQPLASREGLLLLPLHGDLSPQEQDRAVQPASQRKVIFSTNVAESSITIDGVTVVIDSGLARIASDSAWTGIPSLNVTRISQSSATQRAGRAARTAPGSVIRLYTPEDFHRRPQQQASEIGRRELSQTVLDLRSMGIGEIASLPWLEPPPAAAVASAEQLLRRLHALDETGRLTPAGRKMAALPLHPRLACLIVEGVARKAGDLACRVAAVLSAGDRLPGEPPHPSPSDLLLLAEAGLPPRTKQLYEQIRRIVNPPRNQAVSDDAILLSILAAFPDRIARKQPSGELQLSGGGQAMLDRLSSVTTHPFLVAVDIEDRRERGLPLVRIASAVEPEWLLDLFPESVTAQSGVEWNRSAERVEHVSALLYENIVIEQTRSGNPDPEQAAELLAARAQDAGLAGPERIAEILARFEFAAAHMQISPPDLGAALRSVCFGLRGFTELRARLEAGALDAALLDKLPSSARRTFEEVAPDKIRLPGGRHTRVNYVSGQTPWIKSRLQDFFGMKETPRIARGAVLVVVHLLAPNQRPVQMTSDLAGFWQRLYPQVRKELSRRYPRHAWPESP